MPTCVFLSEKSTLFVVSGFAAQCRGPAFFVYGRAAESDVDGRQQTGRRPAAGGARRITGRATQEERRVRDVREKGKTDVFLFLGKRPVDIFFLFWMATTAAGAQLDAGLRRRRAHRMRHGVEHR